LGSGLGGVPHGKTGVPGGVEVPAAGVGGAAAASFACVPAGFRICLAAPSASGCLSRDLRLSAPLCSRHRARLSSGKLQEFGVGDGSKLTLVPTVEAGLMSQASRPEQSVMQALESLTETQVSDFLSGRSPLTLALRVGDHMMFVQLQLAAQHAPLQHRHVLAAAAAAAAARGDPSMTTTPVSSPCRPVSSAARVPPVPSSPTPASSSVTAGSFRSHSASTTCPEQMDCSPPASAGASPTSPAGGSPTSRSRKPGAVIESFVNHAPGVFSGTFSGTLHPNCQDSSGRPRRDIGTILQILNDLLSATRHYQGMPPSLTQLRCHAQCTPASPAPDLAPKTTSCEKLAAAAPASLSQARLCKPPGDRLRQTENRATRCKVERLQLLLQQKRLRRKARRDARGPYHWPPSRKAGRSDSSSSGGGGSPSEASGLGLDFEDSVWKPEVNPDIKSEFVVA
uniref:Midnolin n=1 Tax=Sus scrofa TaxID=9823 RepID=A0A8D0QDH9_PIG